MSANKIIINNINILAVKDLTLDICAICQQNIIDKCNKCESECDECYSIIGVCMHAFHKCCIEHWIHTHPVYNVKCPMCNQKWELKKRSL